MRLAIVDTLTTIAFFTVVAAMTELFIAGMTPQQVLVTRLLTIPVMILAGRPYGIWRDMMFHRFRPTGWVGGTILDAGTFLSFQVPVYGATLWLAGATMGEAIAALGSATVGMLLLARPFGLLLDWVRARTGCIPPV